MCEICFFPNGQGDSFNPAFQGFFSDCAIRAVMVTASKRRGDSDSECDSDSDSDIDYDSDGT